MRVFLAVTVVLSLGSVVRADPADVQKRREEMRKQFMEKFDKNQDGKIDDAERKAIREAFAKRQGEHARGDHGRRGDDRHPKAAHGRSEWAKRMEEHKKKFMAKYDKNQDGKLDEAEKKAIREEFSKSISGAIVGGLDRSDDGKLNVDEVPERLREHFGKADRNKDGYLDKAEVRAALEEAREKLHARIKERMEAHRKHAEGHEQPAAKKQAPSQEEVLFKRLMYGDKNKDGKLNADEMPERLRPRFGAMDANGDGYVDGGELKKVVARLLKTTKR